MPTKYSMKYGDSGTNQQTSGVDSFITFDEPAGSVTVDTSGFVTTPPKIVPSYRSVSYEVCNSVYESVCSRHTMPIMIYDPSMKVATRLT